MVTRMYLRAHRPDRFSRPQFTLKVGVVTKPPVKRMASPEVRVTAPLVEMVKVVAVVPRIVVPKVGAVAGERVTVTWACASLGALMPSTATRAIIRNRIIAASPRRSSPRSARPRRSRLRPPRSPAPDRPAISTGRAPDQGRVEDHRRPAQAAQRRRRLRGRCVRRRVRPLAGGAGG